MSLIVRTFVILGVALGLFASAAVAQRLGPPKPLSPAAPAQTEKPHRTGELDCKNCHVGEHQGVLQMYLGMGGRGTPMIPSHMFQVRVECVACHIVPKEAEVVARIVGQTFTPSDQACVGCHGEKYRGMLARWSATLVRMREIVAPKLDGARAAVAAADPKVAKHARARKLVEDAEHNVRFVGLGKGVHNVFYAADLLKLGNGWLEEAFALVGKTPPKGDDDTLVRGGYCGVLCHEQAGIRQSETVKFGKREIPHVRHVTELGAVCTACHSAEVHKAVTATPATCAACHHGPQNERCESCHSAQSAFYRGQVKSELKVEPNVMVNTVSCTGCHDFTKKHSREAVREKCVGCHDKAYVSFMSEWTSGLEKEIANAAAVLKRAEAALARQKLNKASEPGKLVKEAGEALALVRKARGVHNPQVASALLDRARQKAEAALAQVNRR